MSIFWVKYRNYSGCKINGTVSVPLPIVNSHYERVFYLTAKLEAPMYGAVQSYDGAGMSGGPLHNIAVYPKTLKQGSLFKLLRHLEINASETVAELWDAYKDVGWYLDTEGVLRKHPTGIMVSGTEIRDVFTPLDGRVPAQGPYRLQADYWVKVHHKLFADPRTFNAQKSFAITYLRNKQKLVDTTNLTNAEDLALCVYCSHSVNGPAPARKILESTLKRFNRGDKFVRLLIWSLGTKAFGKWKDTVDGKNRYDRTRYHAKKSGLWPEEFFSGKDAIMPENLPSKIPV